MLLNIHPYIIRNVYFIFFIVTFLLFSKQCICYDDKQDIAMRLINELYNDLDINHDGQIDSIEVKEFTLNELKYIMSSGRLNHFPTNMTKDKLLDSWMSSEIYNWTVEDVRIWLTVYLDMPQYSISFLENNISGSMIPRLAHSDMEFLRRVLRITDLEDLKRISLISKHLILFGIPEDVNTNFIQDKFAFEAIKQLHSQLDDDHDGGVDSQEADEFIRDELKYTSDFERAKGFNKDDDHISKEELWRSWRTSSVFYWTTQDVVEWLVSHVELSEYSEIFLSNRINGSIIPRLALSDMSFLIKDLKIKNPVHRKKILLKSTDLILFGPPKLNHSKMKDAVLLSLTVLITGGCWLAFTQHRYSKIQFKSMQDKMNQLGQAEESLCKLQNKLQEAEIQNNLVTSEKLEIEERLKSEIEKFKEEVIRTDSIEDLSKSKLVEDNLFNQLNLDHGFSQNLKVLLQMTYEIEGQFFAFKRLEAEQQMKNVRDMCERLRKKKSTLMGSLKMAHSGNLDDMDKQISEAKHSIEEVRSDLNERSQRWECIEKLTKLKIFPTPGLTTLKSTFNATNGVAGMAYKNKFHSSSAVSLQSPQSDTAQNISITSNEFHKNDLNCSQNPSSDLFVYIDGNCRDIRGTLEIPSSHRYIDALSDISLNTSYATIPKVYSANGSLSQLYIVQSKSALFNDHYSSNRKLNSNLLYLEGTNGSKSNLTFNLSKVRPFATRWLRKLEKSKKSLLKPKIGSDIIL